ncbi:hypothetical protein CDD83_2630 [Cordyceps sp. RAO-2017]|nr:hypothetical protein CDD83_2630 [Cordyceps sp. RAO-2017]
MAFWSCGASCSQCMYSAGQDDDGRAPDAGVVHALAQRLRADVDVDQHRLRPARHARVAVGHRDGRHLGRAGHKPRPRPGPLPLAPDHGLEDGRVVGPDVDEAGRHAGLLCVFTQRRQRREEDDADGRMPYLPQRLDQGKRGRRPLPYGAGDDDAGGDGTLGDDAMAAGAGDGGGGALSGLVGARASDDIDNDDRRHGHGTAAGRRGSRTERGVASARTRGLGKGIASFSGRARNSGGGSVCLSLSGGGKPLEAASATPPLPLHSLRRSGLVDGQAYEAARYACVWQGIHFCLIRSVDKSWPERRM